MNEENDRDDSLLDDRSCSDEHPVLLIYVLIESKKLLMSELKSGYLKPRKAIKKISTVEFIVLIKS